MVNNQYFHEIRIFIWVGVLLVSLTYCLWNLFLLNIDRLESNKNALSLQKYERENVSSNSGSQLLHFLDDLSVFLFARSATWFNLFWNV